MISLIASLVLFFAVSTEALAEEPADHASRPPVVVVTGAMSYSISMKSLDAFPPNVVHGLGVLVPVSDRWNYYTELATSTGFVTFQPSFIVTTGPSLRVSSHLTIGVTGVYKVISPFPDDTATMHVAGITAAPILPTEIGSISCPFGVVYNATLKDPIFVINAKLSVRPKRK